MSKCNLNLNGRVVRARVGSTLVNAAMGSGVLVPHDCCSGQCETCRVRVVWGAVDDQGTAYGDSVLACQATLAGDATITFDIPPEVSNRAGAVTDIRSLTPDVLEVAIRLAEPLRYLPGQYVGIRFAGYPSRDYSPTARLDGRLDPEELILHVSRLPDGLVSSQFGRGIGIGHKVRVRGPFGQSFLRDRQAGGLLVLTSSGTGWAPMWAVAREAVLKARRDIFVLTGAREQKNLYMGAALNWLKDHGVDNIIVTCREAATADVRLGGPEMFLPPVGATDTVYVAGSMALVEKIKAKALEGSARCYADPFTPSTRRMTLGDRVSRIFQPSRAVPEPRAP